MTTHIAKSLFCLALFAFAGLLVPATSSHAAIVGPYSVDANTVNLWHMDEAANNPVNSVGGGLALTAVSSYEGGMNYAAYTGFGTAGRLNRNCCSNGNGIGTEERGWRTADFLPPAAVWGSFDGAFTIEMMLNFTWTNHSDNQFFDIFRTESTNFRGRILNGGSATSQNLEFTVPNSHTFTANNVTVNEGTWYHLAMAYDGTSSTTDNVRIYWTEVNDTNTEANLVGTFSLSSSDTYTLDHFELGSDSGGQINAYIDEVRISNIARAADDMQFSGAVPEPSSMVLAGLGLVGLIGWGLRRRQS